MKTTATTYAARDKVFIDGETLAEVTKMTKAGHAMLKLLEPRGASWGLLPAGSDGWVVPVRRLTRLPDGKPSPALS